MGPRAHLITTSVTTALSAFLAIGCSTQPHPNSINITTSSSNNRALATDAPSSEGTLFEVQLSAEDLPQHRGKDDGIPTTPPPARIPQHINDATVDHWVILAFRAKAGIPEHIDDSSASGMPLPLRTEYTRVTTFSGIAVPIISTHEADDTWIYQHGHYFQDPHQLATLLHRIDTQPAHAPDVVDASVISNWQHFTPHPRELPNPSPSSQDLLIRHDRSARSLSPMSMRILRLNTPPVIEAAIVAHCPGTIPTPEFDESACLSNGILVRSPEELLSVLRQHAQAHGQIRVRTRVAQPESEHNAEQPDDAQPQPRLFRALTDDDAFLTTLQSLPETHQPPRTTP